MALRAFYRLTAMSSHETDRALVVTGFATPQDACADEENRELVVNVIYTTEKRTLEALKTAAQLASELDARMNLIVAQPVPIALPIDRPHINADFLVRRLKALVRRASQDDLETSVNLYFCRDLQRTLTNILPAKSVVVMGDRNRWWRSEFWRIRKTLEAQGHRVLMVSGR